MTRGAFICIEGIDHSGKTTQARLLAEHLSNIGVVCKTARYPDRSTRIGSLIDEYLTGKTHLEDHAVHLLFAANRWELAESVRADLATGVTVIIDRYSYSGAAYSAAKGIPISWCTAPDVGLPTPDVVIYLAIDPATAMSRVNDRFRERYENSKFQGEVARRYEALFDGRWRVVDASVDVAGTHELVRAAALETIRDVR